jgi:hypothetical protein
MLNYIFRKPKFPVICDIDGYIIAAKSEKSFVKHLSGVKLDPEKTYNLMYSQKLFTPLDVKNGQI